MGSTLVKAESYLVSTDLGIMQVKLSTVTGYDVEDIVHDKAISQARSVQMLYLGKRVSPLMPTTPRTVSSVYLNNEEEVG